MDQQPASSGPLPGDAYALAGQSDGTSEQASRGIKTALVNLIPPVTLAAVVTFWGLAPESVVSGPWTLTIVGVAIMAWIQGLEFLFERHQGWRLNRREFATDVFYVVQTGAYKAGTEFFPVLHRYRVVAERRR